MIVGHPGSGMVVGSIVFGPPGMQPFDHAYGMGPYIVPGQSIVGTCSCCGGPVTVPTVWGAVIPPIPTCSKCGATKKANHGPVIDMEPAK
jgi:hypothetical protein